MLRHSTRNGRAHTHQSIPPEDKGRFGIRNGVYCLGCPGSMNSLSRRCFAKSWAMMLPLFKRARSGTIGMEPEKCLPGRYSGLPSLPSQMAKRPVSGTRLSKNHLRTLFRVRSRATAMEPGKHLRERISSGLRRLPNQVTAQCLVA